MKTITVCVGIALIFAGLSLFVLFAVINPMTLKTDTASCPAFEGFGGGSCGKLYGGILPDFFWENWLIFAILSILVAVFGGFIVAMPKLTIITRRGRI